jgi:2-octaprenyl-6-methoxyphenol hydroxylase
VRASAVSAGSKRLLDVLGIWEALAPHAEPVAAVDITDAALDDVFRPVLVTYDNTVAGAEPATYIVENERLRAAIIGGIARRAGVVRIGGTVAAAELAGARGVVRLADERTLEAPLVVAADGRASPMREAAGIGVVGWRYPQIGIVTTVAHARPHHGKAVQHFLPSGPFAILPLTDNRSSIVWTEERALGEAIVAGDASSFLAELTRRFGFRLGEISLAGPRQSFPLDMQIARSFVADRLALIGDAAHVVHPLAGQGLNIGMRDVAALAETLVDATRLGLDIGSAATLERYERWRRFDSAFSAAVMDGLNRLFSNDNAPLRSLRDLGLGLVDRAPALKRFLVSEAAGATGTLPRLLKGERV